MRTERPAALLLARLKGVRRTSDSSWMAQCPAHVDDTPSLSVREAGDGRVLIFDFGGCGAADVVSAVGLDLADLFPPRLDLTYGPSRPQDIPRIPAADALRLLDGEALYVALAAEALADGDDLALHRELLLQAACRIGEIHRLWRAQP